MDALCRAIIMSIDAHAFISCHTYESYVAHTRTRNFAMQFAIASVREPRQFLQVCFYVIVCVWSARINPPAATGNK